MRRRGACGGGERERESRLPANWRRERRERRERASGRDALREHAWWLAG